VSELAGFGTLSWLPASVLKAQAIEELGEAAEARRAETERENRAEDRRDRALASYRAMAMARGEDIPPLQLAAGVGLGRTIEDIFHSAVAMADHADAREAARLRIEGTGPPQHIEVGEPVIHRTPEARKVASRSRRFNEWRAKRQAAEDARRALTTELDWGLAASQRKTPKQDPVIDGTVGRRAATRDDRVSYRAGRGARPGEMSRVTETGFVIR
jgi:hypothetical protein